MSTNQVCCSFCGKSEFDVGAVVAGPTVYICDECIELCVDVLELHDDKAPIHVGAWPAKARLMAQYAREYRMAWESTERDLEEAKDELDGFVDFVEDNLYLLKEGDLNRDEFENAIYSWIDSLEDDDV